LWPILQVAGGNQDAMLGKRLGNNAPLRCAVLEGMGRQRFQS
jgi:hypothetical protein